MFFKKCLSYTIKQLTNLLVKSYWGQLNVLAVTGTRPNVMKDQMAEPRLRILQLLHRLEMCLFKTCSVYFIKQIVQHRR